MDTSQIRELAAHLVGTDDSLHVVMDALGFAFGLGYSSYEAGEHYGPDSEFLKSVRRQLYTVCRIKQSPESGMWRRVKKGKICPS